MNHTATPFSSMVLVFTGAFIGSIGAAFLKAGAGRLKFTVAGMASNWRLLVGILAYCVSSVFFVYGNTRGELSVLYPIVSLGYIWTLVWSRLFFREPFTRVKFVGVSLILVGVFFLNASSR
jgi:multidrug transporter EmrE-like cation transporter